MKCPRDNSSLQTKTYEADIEVDICPSCRGIWLDKGELEKIEEIREHDYSEQLKQIPDLIGKAYEMARQKARPEINCPKCARKMEIREYAYCSQIIMDVCPKSCGIWLDSGETQALEIFYERCRSNAGQMKKTFLKSLLNFFK